MQNKIATWRLDPAEQQAFEKVAFFPEPESLDDVTQRLPGGGYTTLRTFGRFRVLRLEDHFARLEETARLSGRSIYIDRSRLSQALREALGDYPQEQMRVRIILDLEKEPGAIYILIDGLQIPRPEDYQRGVRAVTRKLQRQNPKAKLTGFIETAAAVRHELPVGMNEAIMIGEDGRLLEGLSSNFFAVKNGVIWTAEEGVLSGITRSLVLKVIRDQKLPLKLEGLRVAELGEIEEAFITSASRAVLPVTEIDGKKVGDGMPGSVTRQIMEGYKERLEEELEIID